MRKFSENEQKTYDTLLNSLASAVTPEMIVAAMDNIERFLKIVDAFGAREPLPGRVPSVFDRTLPAYYPNILDRIPPYHVSPISCGDTTHSDQRKAYKSAVTESTTRRKTDG